MTRLVHTIKAKGKNLEKMKECQRKVLNALRVTMPDIVTTGKLRNLSKVAKQTLNKTLRLFEEMGIVKKIRRGRWRVSSPKFQEYYEKRFGRFDFSLVKAVTKSVKEGKIDYIWSGDPKQGPISAVFCYPKGVSRKWEFTDNEVKLLEFARESYITAVDRAKLNLDKRRESGLILIFINPSMGI